MITVYAESSSPRLSYTLEVMFVRCAGIPFRLIHSRDEFLASSEPRLNYSQVPLEGILQIVPDRLLFETHIEVREIFMEQWEEIPVFFRTSGGLLPFDLFACAFYLISRYEEYATEERDQHNRFPSSLSLAYREGFLERPVVNEWTLALVNRLKNIPEGSNEFHFLSSVDVDMAFCYRNKGVRRNLGGLMKELVKGKFRSARHRIRVLRHKEPDPYDNFAWQRSVHSEYTTRCIYFILLGEHGRYDKNIRHDKPAFIHLVQSLAGENMVGIHPSYASNGNTALLSTEIHRLEEIIGKKVKAGRQHFLKFDVRHTFSNLEKEGITQEYSMGYSDRPGFRAGICQPYPFFNLMKNEAGELMLHPFVVMDVALMRFMKLSPREASEKISELLDTVRRVHGVFVSVFHNESLSDFGEWRGWRKVYQDMLRVAQQAYDSVYSE